MKENTDTNTKKDNQQVQVPKLANYPLTLGRQLGNLSYHNTAQSSQVPIIQEKAGPK